MQGKLCFYSRSSVGTSANDFSNIAGVDIFNYPHGFSSPSCKPVGVFSCLQYLHFLRPLLLFICLLYLHFSSTFCCMLRVPDLLAEVQYWQKVFYVGQIIEPTAHPEVGEMFTVGELQAGKLTRLFSFIVFASAF